MQIFKILLMLSLHHLSANVAQNEKLTKSIVKSSYHKTTISEAQRNVLVLSGDEIEKSNIHSLRDALQSIPGIKINDDPATLSSSLTMNGMGGENVKIIIDGVTQVGLVSGQIDLSQIPLSNVESIEIIETPLSVEYGSNAVGGVINIKTKSLASQETFTGKLNTNWESTKAKGIGIEASIRFEKNNVSHVISSSLQNQIQESIAADSLRKPLWSPVNQMLLTGGYSISFENWDIQLGYNGIYDEKKLLGNWNADPTTLVLDPVKEEFVAKDSLAKDLNYETTRHNLHSLLSWDLSENQSIQWQITQAIYKRNSRESTIRWINGDEIKEESAQTKYKASTANVVYKNRTLQKLLFILGAEGGFYEVEGERIVNRIQDMRKAATFGSWSWGILDELNIEFGIRYQYNSDYEVKTFYETAMIPSVGMSWQLNELAKVTMGYSRGFRAPSMQELYFNFHDGGSHDIDGNPELLPETSHNYYFTLVQHPNKKTDNVWTQKYTLYYHILEDKIALGEKAKQPGFYQYQNLNKFKSIGGSMSYKWAFNKSIDVAATTHLDGISVLRDETAVPYTFLITPSASWELSYHFPFYLDLTYKHRFFGQEPQYEIVEENGEEIIYQAQSESWHQIDFLIQQKMMGWGQEVKLNLGVKNILDIQSLNSVGNTKQSGHGSGGDEVVSKGRQWFVAMQYQF